MLGIKNQKRLNLVIRYTIIIVWLVITLFPIMEMVTTSLKNQVDAFSIPPKWFFTPNMDNYINIITEHNFFRYFFNSIVVALTVTFLSVFMGAIAAYSLVSFNFKGKNFLVLVTLIIRMIPPVILVVPIFLMYNKLGIINSRIGLIFVYIALNLPFNIWILMTFIQDIPKTLEESALIDGCSDFGVFFKIIFPLITPGMAVASIFTFRIAWNEFILSLVLTNRATRTLPVAVSLFLKDSGTEWGNITAIATIISIPAFIFTFSVAKSLIQGITAGAVKG
ncbi:MAG: carbohydrate ABC transporter permease [Spirochaetes bacterium]|nr:carbohydrate ABC transporter permease [Spirochaetota bacterium]